MRFACICSTLNPTHKELEMLIHSARKFDEIIIHIDADTVVEVNQKNDPPNVKYVTCNLHLSLAQGYNLAAAVANADYLSVQGYDDYYDIENLDIAIEHIKNHPEVDILNFDTIAFGDGGNQYRKYCLPTLDILKDRCCVSSASFIRKSCFDEVGGYAGDSFQDYILWFKCALHGFKFDYLPLPVMHSLRRREGAGQKQLDAIGWDRNIEHREVYRYAGYRP
jgi:hypothetical protein